MWVDCFIDKLLTINPNIREFTAMINRWDIEFDIIDNKVDFDCKRILKTQELLFDHYQIGCKSIKFKDDIESYLKENTKILMPCDLYYLPFATQYYNKSHIYSYLLVSDVNDSAYYVYDDNPYFLGWMEKDVVQMAYSAVQDNLEMYYKPAVKTSIEQDLGFFLKNFSAKSLYLSKICNKIFSLPITKKEMASILVNIRVPAKRFYAFPRIVESISEEVDPKYRRYNDLFKQYADCWTVLTNLAELFENDQLASWTRIDRLATKVCEYEENLKVTSIEFVTELQHDIK